MSTKESFYLCLGHGEDDRPNGCAKANECQRHLTLRERNFPGEATIVGCACTKNGYPLFVPAEFAKIGGGA